MLDIQFYETIVGRRGCELVRLAQIWMCDVANVTPLFKHTAEGFIGNGKWSTKQGTCWHSHMGMRHRASLG